MQSFTPESFQFQPAIHRFYVPPRYHVPNKKVAVEPFPASVKAEVKNGVLQPMNHSALTPLKVVFGGNYTAGHTVYVRTKISHTTTYGKEVFEVDGQKFILIPEEDVVLIDAGAQDTAFSSQILTFKPAVTSAPSDPISL